MAVIFDIFIPGCPRVNIRIIFINNWQNILNFGQLLTAT